MDALARIPPATIRYAKRPAPWSPAARPMDPVLRVGLYANEDPLVNKQVVVGRPPEKSDNPESGSDEILYVPVKDSLPEGGDL